MTIAGLMVIVAIVAISVWFFRTSLSQEWSLPALLAIAAGYFLVVPPILVKSKRGISDDPQYEPVAPSSDQVPQRVADTLAEAIPGLEALGYLCRGHYRSQGTVPNAASYVSLFENPQARRTAQLFTVFVATGLVRQVSTVMNFKTEFSDGTALTTGNSRVAGAFPPVRLRRGSMSFPWITDPGELYEIHAASVAHYAADGIPVEPGIQDPAEFLRTSSWREMAKFAEVGYMRLDEERRIYRYTWKGAFLMAWKLSWPIRSIRQWLRRRKAAGILGELGLDHLAYEG
jgi:hypothetical protein